MRKIIAQSAPEQIHLIRPHAEAYLRAREALELAARLLHPEAMEQPGAVYDPTHFSISAEIPEPEGSES